MDTDTRLSEDRGPGQRDVSGAQKPPEAPRASEGARPRRHLQLRLWPLEVWKMTPLLF